MGWASRANEVARDVKAGLLKPKERKASPKVQRDQARMKVPLLASVLVAMGVPTSDVEVRGRSQGQPGGVSERNAASVA